MMLTVWTARNISPSICCMGSRNPERDRLWGSELDKLGQYAKGYLLVAYCKRDACTQSRQIPVSFLLKRFSGDMTLGQVAQHLRCSQCGLRGARFEARYRGPWGDGR